MARCRSQQTEDQLRVGVFSGENFKIFQNFTKNLKTIQNTKIVSKLCKRVVSGGGWWGSGAYMGTILFYSFNTMYIHILYTLNIHILCTFSGILCTNTVYYTLYTGLFYSEILCGKSAFSKTSYIHLISFI